MKISFSLLLFVSLISAKDLLITPIPQILEYDKQKALLGKKLFFEKKLSQGNVMSCATCHLLQEGGDDNLIGSKTITGEILSRNTPTVYNAIFNEFQHWDAGVKTLEEQASSSIHHPLAMNTNFKDIINKLKKDKDYVYKFANIYNSQINEYNILNAIAEFEKTLITPNSKFDKYLNGNKNILNENELDGYKSFKEYGCISCHNGINIGGNLIQKIGILQTYKTNDMGRFYISNADEDMYYFKVPSLRNISLTSPYFHDGKVKTLKEAVEKMIQYQIGYDLSEEKVNNIILFLKTLTGEIPDISKKNNE